MAYTDTPIKVPARLHCTTALGILADASEVYDMQAQQLQSNINKTLSDKVADIENIVGSGANPDVIPVTDNVSAVTIEADSVVMCSGNAANLAVTMQLPEYLHNKAYIYTVLFKSTNSAPNITFSHSQSSYNIPINVPSDFAVEPNVWNEIQVLFCAADESSEFFVRIVNYK